MYDYLCMRNVLDGTYVHVNCCRHDVCVVVTLEMEVNVGVDIGCLETLCHQFKLTSSLGLLLLPLYFFAQDPRTVGRV
jgi:hypothetical protein